MLKIDNKRHLLQFLFLFSYYFFVILLLLLRPLVFFIFFYIFAMHSNSPENETLEKQKNILWEYPRISEKKNKFINKIKCKSTWKHINLNIENPLDIIWRVKERKEATKTYFACIFFLFREWEPRKRPSSLLDRWFFILLNFNSFSTFHFDCHSIHCLLSLFSLLNIFH